MKKTTRRTFSAVSMLTALVWWGWLEQPAISAAASSNPAGAAGWDLPQKLQQAEAGNQWAAYELWDAYHRGKHGVQPDPGQAEKWLGTLVQDLWLVRFEPVDDFTPPAPQNSWPGSTSIPPLVPAGPISGRPVFSGPQPRMTSWSVRFSVTTRTNSRPVWRKCRASR